LIQNVQFAKPKGEPAAKTGGSQKRQLEGDAFATVSLVPGSVPNRILFAQNLPKDVSEHTLQTLFGQCAGLEEVRLAPGSRGIAFFEFEDDVTATMALKQLNGFQLSPSCVLQLSYSS
jgi:U2 small nuclear ribonucleoprotein B''